MYYKYGISSVKSSGLDMKETYVIMLESYRELEKAINNYEPSNIINSIARRMLLDLATDKKMKFKKRVKEACLSELPVIEYVKNIVDVINEEVQILWVHVQICDNFFKGK